MSDKLTFSQMTWDLLEDKHGVQSRFTKRLFDGCPEVQPSDALVTVLRRGRSFRLVNERAKAYRLIDPVLAEVEALRLGQITSIPELYLEVKGMEGLCGNPDFVLSASLTAKALPIIAIVEAKRDDIDAGLPQCAAELYAAYLLNGSRLDRVYGCVTTGLDWKFLCFEGASKLAYIDLDTYLLSEAARLLGVLCHIVDTSLAGLKAPASTSPSSSSS